MANDSEYLDELTEWADLGCEICASRWHPIETAPKDGTRVLGGWFMANSSFIIEIIYWDDWSKLKEGGSIGWYVINCEGLHHEDPTHWMPLPEPPGSE